MKSTATKTDLDALFKAGAHLGFGKSKRHPSSKRFIFGSKNKLDILDLELTSERLEKALEFVKQLKESNSEILLVGGKNEASDIIKEAAEKINVSYVSGRWIGGTLTNFVEIKKRVDTMLDLISQKEKGELAKYTKKERLLIDRDIDKLKTMFWGIRDMKNLPKALFIIDPRYEKTALKEASDLGIKTIALCGTDNDMNKVNYPIPGNDSSRKSIQFFVDKFVETWDH